jgi:chromosome segregation ATPase
MSDDKKQVKDVADILFQEKYLTDQDKSMVQNQSTGWLQFLALKAILSGIRGERLQQLLSNKLKPDEAMGLYTVYMTDLYRENDELAKEITSVTNQAKESIAEYDELKQMLAGDLKAALESERDSLQKQLAGKDNFIDMMQKDHDRLEKENSELKAAGQKKDEKIAELEGLVNAKSRSATTSSQSATNYSTGSVNVCRNEAIMQEKHGVGLWGFMRGNRKRQQDLEHFITQVLSNKNCDEEHQAFLMSCLEQGYSVDEIERYFSNPKWSIELLERFRDFYNLQYRGR